MPFHKLEKYKIGRIRPRFKLESPLSKEQIIKILRTAAEKNDSVDCIQQQSRFLRLSIPEAEQHYWSPVLKISCDDNEIEGKTIIRGHIGPNESVWSIFFLVYASVTALGFFGSIWAYAQWFFDKNPYYLIIIPLAVVIISTMFIASKIGQRKAHKQTLHIMRFLKNATNSIDLVDISV